MKIGEMKESNYIKKEDVGVNGKNLTIRDNPVHENVAGEGHPPEMKYVLYFKEAKKGAILNQTNIALIAHVVGSEETNDWVGKQIQLFEDPTVGYAGKIMGGIRVRHVSNATAPPTPAPIPNNDFDDDIPF